jgi:hypothetical protein
MNQPEAGRQAPRLMLVELNEFDPELLRGAATRFGLRNLLGLLELTHSRTTTEDRVEHDGLDPWVQWVGIHTGVPTADHGVRRLGETRSQQRPQIWNVLGARGLRWGAWGVMNAPLGAERGCEFFMPDPWSFDERAFPEGLNDVLALPRYVSKNYLDIDRGEALRRALRFALFFARPSNLAGGLRFAAAAVRLAVRSRAHLDVHTCTTLLDLLSALMFVRLRARYRPEFSVIFLNHIAHLQHQFWQREGYHPQMELGLRACDAILGLLFADRRPGEAIVVVNAFRQNNVAGEGVEGYRQRNPADALRALGIADGSVEQCMTNDAHVVFPTAEAADRAQAILESCELDDGRTVFAVERKDATGLFYRIQVERHVPDGAVLRAAGRVIPFGDVFAFLAHRTGAHTPEGDVFADGIALPEQFPNHTLFDAILRYFTADAGVRAA